MVKQVSFTTGGGENLRRLERQRLAAELRRQEAETPLGRGDIDPRGPMHPTQGLAQMLKAYGASQDVKGIEEEQDALEQMRGRDMDRLSDAGMVNNLEAQMSQEMMVDEPGSYNPIPSIETLPRYETPEMAMMQAENQMQSRQDEREWQREQAAKPIPTVTQDGVVYNTDTALPVIPGSKPKEKPPFTGAVLKDGKWVMSPGLEESKIKVAKAGADNTSNQFDIKSGEGYSPGWKKIDEGFATTYNDFLLSGGYADAEKQINQLKGVTVALQNAIDTGGNLTGPLLALNPDVVKTFTNPESIQVREAVEEVVQRNLRVVLGAQFTEKEGERLISRAYNPALGEEKNLERVQNLLKAMETAYNAKMKAIAYFEENGTLQGYRGGRANARSVYATVGASDLLDSAGNPIPEPEDELIF